MKKILFQNNGFSLLEVVVAMGITAVALMATLEYSVQGQKTSKSQNLDVDFFILESNVETVLDYDCKNALVTGGPIAYNPANLPIPLGAIPLANVTVGQPTIGMQVTQLAFTQPSTVIATQGTLTEYLANFNVSAQKVTNQTGNFKISNGVQNYSRDMKVAIWVDGGGTGNIVDCQVTATPPVLTVAIPSSAVGPTGGTTMTWSVVNYVSATLTGSDGSTFPIPPSSNTVPITSNTAGPVTYTLTVITNSNQTLTASVTETYN